MKLTKNILKQIIREKIQELREESPAHYSVDKKVIKKIIGLMKKEKIKSKDASPNFVADFAYNNGFKNLKSAEIVYISDNY